MKKNILFILIVLALYSCSKSSNSDAVKPVNNSTLIVGKWYATSDVQTTTDKTGSVSAPSTVTYNRTDNITFNNDGTGIDVQGTNSLSFTYTVKNNDAIITYTNSSPWTVPIKTISASSLELYYVIGPDATDGHSENHDITYSK